MTKKILCIDARLIFSGGIGTYLKSLLFLLKDSDFSIILLINPEAEKQLPWLSAFKIIPFASPIYSIEEQYRLPFLIPRCDLFWTPHFNVPLVPIRARKRITTIHDVYHLAFYSSLSLLEKFYAKLCIGRAISSSNRIITISNFSKQELLKYTSANPAKILPISLGIDRNHFSSRANPERLEEVKSRYKLPEKFLLFVGNLKPHKNLKGLMGAFALVWQNGYQDLSLVLAGRNEGFTHGENINKLLADAPRLKNQIHVTGHIAEEDLPYVYQQAKMVVFPSFYEGFGLPALEAMSMGIPLVVSRAASLPEVCEEAAIYVNPYDPQDIARGILQVLSDKELQQTLINRGKKRCKLFDWKKTAERHIDLFESICL